MTNSVFKTALLACIVQAGSAFFCPSANAQTTSEVGIGLGATNYRGEISPKYQFLNTRPACTAFYRKDVSVPVTLRGGLTGGFLRAADENVKGVKEQLSAGDYIEIEPMIKHWVDAISESNFLLIKS